MDAADALIQLLVVLVAAKLAAELSERVGIPPVLGEIAAGILVGPSVLHLVDADNQFLMLLGEIGVILLLLGVGMEMDLAELGRVGRASLTVAVVGVVLPFASGYAAISALGYGNTTAIFLGAALTATSVGITARAFADLRMLATVESRIVIGAAVADDILGLIILTVVARIAEQGSVDVGQTAVIVAVALGFLLLTTGVGLALAPRLFSLIQRRSRSTGTMVALVMAFTLAFALLAEKARLAPIVGAFVAGLALSRSRQAERIQRDLAPLSHLLIPVFFLEIGANTNLSSFTRPSVLGLAGAMCVVAIVGKVLAGWGAVGTRSDRLFVGLGMIPRGEVGLIFATIGLSAKVLDADLYAALILVVLVTTVITPPLLMARSATTRRRARESLIEDVERPDGGWLTLSDGVVSLRGRPPAQDTLRVHLHAARLAAEHTPSEELLQWMSHSHPEAESPWDADTVRAFDDLLRNATTRSWRLLDAAGTLDAAIPELADTLHSRRSDTSLLDPAMTHRFATLERLGDVIGTDGDAAAITEAAVDADPAMLLYEALAADMADAGGPEAPDRIRSLLARVRRTVIEQEEAVSLARDGGLLRAAAQRETHDEEALLPLAEHLGTAARARRLYILSLALGDLSSLHRDRLDAAYDELIDVLSDPELAADGSFALVEQRRRSALSLAGDSWDARRVATAPRSLILSLTPEQLVDRVSLLGSAPPAKGQVRVSVIAGTDEDDHGPVDEINVIARDAPGLLARITGALANMGVEVLDASAASWPDRSVLDSFRVRRPNGRIDPDQLAAAIRSELRRPLAADAIDGARIDFDEHASPWHTVCTIEAPDQPGLLHAVTTAFAVNGVNVHTARVSTTEDGTARDRFGLTDRRGAKLDAATRAAVIESLVGGAGGRRRWWARAAEVFAV